MKSDPEQTEPSEGEAGFIRRLTELSQAPKADAARRVAFQAELDRRLARRPRRFVVPALAGAEARVSRLARAQPRATTSVEAPLALASEDDDTTDASLPDEYIAIASLFLTQ